MEQPDKIDTKASLDSSPSLICQNSESILKLLLFMASNYSWSK